MPYLKDKLPGGLADGENLNQYCPKQILKGLLVELEHTDDLPTAMEIVTDHLEENRKYYDYLDGMEKKMDKGKKGKKKSFKLSSNAWQRIADHIGTEVAEDDDILETIDELIAGSEDQNMRSKLMLIKNFFKNPENLKAAKRAAEGPITEEGGLFVQQSVPTFTIMPEYLEYWGNVPADTQVTDDMVQELSRTWQVPVEELYNTLQPSTTTVMARRNQMKTATKWFYNNNVEPPSRRRNQMNRKAEYQGWSNYETWAVALWIDNDRGLYEAVQEMKGEFEESYELGDAIKSFMDEIIFDEDVEKVSPVSKDLLTGALSEVNWREIAEHVMAE